MQPPPASKLVATTCALCAMAIAIVVGLAVDNPADVILLRALVSAAACYAVGAVLGAVVDTVVRDAVRAHKQRDVPAAQPVEVGEARDGTEEIFV